MLFSELYRARVRSRDGVLLGRVRAVHCQDGEIVQLGIGAGALLRRLSGRVREHRIAWDKVIEVRDGEVIVARTRGT